MKEPLADDESQDGIAEKLKPLVRGQAVLGPRGMGDRRHEEVAIAKRVTYPPLAFPHVDARPGRGPVLPPTSTGAGAAPPASAGRDLARLLHAQQGGERGHADDPPAPR